MNKFHIVGIVVIVGLAFYGGTKVGGSDGREAQTGQGQFSDWQGGHDGGFGQMGQANQGFVGGTILSVDENGITVKLADGGSRIVLISSETEITKSAKGTSADLVTGEQVLITGAQNEDGTISAESARIGGADFRVLQRPDSGDAH